jgi:hypothetical protein
LKTNQDKLQKLKGETSYLSGEHGKAKEVFKEAHANRGPTEHDAVKGLIDTDPAKYTTMMTDLAMGGGASAAPIWANLPFLERGPADSLEGMDTKERLFDDIGKLKQEKSDFAAELEKAQSLLRLQTDIEKENTVYFNQEVKRLTLIEKSSKAKVEELARRADEKAKTINDFQRKTATAVGSRAASPDRTLARNLDQAEVMTEFSTKTNESEIRTDENVLDFKIEDAEFYLDAFSQVSGVRQDDENRTLITVCTVDFYNHSTETTQMAEGVKANYQTQFSFVNTVDNFYVNFL